MRALYDLPMACRGVLFALTASQDAALVATGDDDEVGDFVEKLESDWDWDWLCEVDKAWDAMHRCLSDGTLRLGRQTGNPLELVVLGGGQHYEGDDYVVAHVRAAEAPEVSAALDEVDREWLRARYDAIDPDDYEGELGDEDFEYTWNYLQDVRAFYRNAVKDGRSVVFTVDQ
jgi:Domain of unknown function (DUF1877)